MKHLFILMILLASFRMSFAQWAFIKGNGYDSRFPRYSTLNQQGNYNTPGGQRSGCATWVYNHELYLFGGITSAPDPLPYYNQVNYNDIWKYNKATGLWIWIKGSNQPDDTGSLGTVGVEAASNLPRSCSNFNFWILGHKLYIYNGKMWRYNMVSNNWTCLKKPPNNSMHYGQKGIEDSLNTPGFRGKSVCWTINGDLYLFGGAKSNDYYSDIWRYDTATNNWAWIKGPNYANSYGTLGQIGLVDSTNNPSARADAYHWLINDTLYIYGGNQSIYTNPSDFWKYDYASNNWVCLSNNSSTPNYGLQNTLAATNTPGSRAGGQSWVSNGNMYLFGGASAGTFANLYNDIWEYIPSQHQWKWIKGSNYPNKNGTYNYRNVTLPSNQPGARVGGLFWEGNDSIYIANGSGNCFNGNVRGLADMWAYNKTTNNWVWVYGINNASIKDVSYHNGQEDVNNSPGTNITQAIWQSGDSTYIYTHPGGSILNIQSYPIPQTDEIWLYNNADNNWTLLRLNFAPNGLSVYGTLNTLDSANTPGYRTASAYWFLNNKLYMFGGMLINQQDSLSNSLWEYDLNTGQWKWIKGSQHNNQTGTYGTQGIAASSNVPGARSKAQFGEWNGKFFLFGGYGYDQNGNKGNLNDMWEYDPQTNNWKWLKGSKTKDAPTNAGTTGVFNSNNHPGGRNAGTSWVNNNSFYVFSGIGVYLFSNGSDEYLPELWEYNFVSNNWRFLKGFIDWDPNSHYGYYGTIGVPGTTTRPGQRIQAASAVVDGKLYLFGGYGAGAGLLQGGGRSDLWSYNPTTNNWTWLARSPNSNGSTIFPGTPGITPEQAGPGSRIYAAGWGWNHHFYISGGETGTDIYNNEVWRYNLCDSATQCYNTPPIVNLGNDTTLCNGNYMELNAGNYGNNFLWSTGDTTQSISVTQSGTFWVKVTNPNNLTSRDTIQITLLDIPQQPFQPGVQTICTGSSILLNAQNTGSTFLWSTGDTTQTLQVDSSGIYSVRIGDANGCSLTVSEEVFAAPKPNANLGNDTGICAFYQGIQIYLPAPYNSHYTYLWNTGDTLNETIVDSAGDYSIKVTNQYGCISRDTIHVSFDTLLSNFTLGNDTVICQNRPMLLNVYHPGYTYYWPNSGDTSASISIDQADTYTVYIVSPFGCQNDASININVEPLPSADSIVAQINNLSVHFSISNPVEVSSRLWKFGDSATDSGPSPVHYFASGGSYNIELIIINYCGSDTLHKTIVLQQPPNGIESRTKNDGIHVFPNPASRDIFIQSDENNINRISLTNVIGQILFSQLYSNKKSAIVNISSLPPGAYIIKIETQNTITNKKIEKLQ